MKIRMLLILLCSGLMCAEMYADCTASPQIGVTVVPHPDGTATVTVPYAFPETVDGSQRSVTVLVTRAGSPGTARGIGSFHPGDASGTWTTEDELFCEPSDVYTYTAYATACNRSDLSANANTTNAFNGDPSVSLQYVGPNDQGVGTVRVTYNFPNTSAANQRTLTHTMSYPGGLHGTAPYHPPDQSGVWEFEFP
ncbi:MAG TPA: hypothetical protein VM733_08095, partial [Thermoanaerobaculia bacterium]|nr:hypothetical protein [Thermoanaerobaculia bacterium]